MNRGIKYFILKVNSSIIFKVIFILVLIVGIQVQQAIAAGSDNKDYALSSLQESVCAGDLDNDLDVDGSDLAFYVTDSQGISIDTFAANFGRRDCIAKWYHPPYQAMTPEDYFRFDQLYYIQPHNTYEHSSCVTNWLDAGYRSVEIDVIDRGDWENDIHGPYVSHDANPGDVNCSNPDGDDDRLGNCIDDIIAWQDINQNELPLLVFVDMKASWDPANAWYGDEVAQLDQFIGNYLGSRMYKYSDLIIRLNRFAGTTYREKLKNGGWPTIGNLRNKIIVVLTGGRFGDVNDGMEQATVYLWPNLSTFMCPDIDNTDPEEIYDTIDSISPINSGYFFCANVSAGDHYQIVANKAAEYKQILHLWGTAGDFANTDYAASFIAVAHGASALGWDVSQSLSDPNVHMPDWTWSIPLVGVRRSLPGYFKLHTRITNGEKCLAVSGATYSNGSDLVQYSCHSGYNQQFVYTAEGQLRPRGDNRYCTDFSSGSADNGDEMHLWDCDGGNSEKWAVTPYGLFKNRDNGYTHCMDVPGSSTLNGLQLYIWACHGGLNQQFILESVPDWDQFSF